MAARLSLDLGEERKARVENYRSDPAWKNLSFNGKVQSMIDILLELTQRCDQTIGKIICDHWEKVIGKVSIPSDRLINLRAGYRATDAELVQLATVLPFNTHQLAAMQTEPEDTCTEPKPKRQYQTKE